jgi:branched-chain amino acid transport system permease protein
MSAANPGRVDWRQESAGLFIGFALLAVLPLGFGDTYSRHILIMSFIYAIVASNWDLSLGYGGVFNFGHIALFGIGCWRKWPVSIPGFRWRRRGSSP